MDSSTINVLSLCSGYGGLELGLSAALGSSRTVCWVEWDAYPAALLAARMAEKSLDEAPIWSDVRTFDGRPWRGVVDCITAGYPCQPFSKVGRQHGADDPRHLWPHIARIIAEVRPRFCFFENVRNHVNIGLSEVAADLERMGYTVECGIFSAEEVGATHLRERLFILAYSTGSGFAATIPDCSEHQEQDAPLALFPPRPTSTEEWRSVLALRPELAPAVAHSRSLRGGTNVADTRRPRRQSADIGASCLPDDSHGQAGQPDGNFGYPGVHPGGYRGGPESLFCGVADGSSPNMARHTEQLRLGGNGVVPLQAAYAFSVLARRTGLSD